MKRFVIAAALVLSATTANAWSDLESIKKATSLGNLLGSEEACELVYKQKAIETYIQENIPATDMSFIGLLSTMSTGAEYRAQRMSRSQKTAHCMLVKRASKANGFID